MKMLIRTTALYLNYLRMRVKYRKQILFRGFSVICALKGSSIQFNTTGGQKNLHLFPSFQQHDRSFSEMYHRSKKGR